MNPNKFLYSSTILTPLAALLLCATAGSAVANPQDGVVSAGSATISVSGKKLDVTQHTNKTVIDWRSFDIAPDETTQFYQPSSKSIALNRVNSSDPSKILGALSANGNLVLVNPNGVMFGVGSRVDVNGLIATTADIDNDKFMSDGKLVFNKPGNPNAAIINQGTITAKEAGLVGLVAPNVINDGVITAKLGRVQLASGDTTTVDLYGDSLMEVAVSDAVKSQLVSNTGKIDAAGGTIALTAAAGNQIVNSLITVEGELRAPSVGKKNGKIFIYGEGSNAVKGNVATDKGKKQGSSTVLVAGTLDASGYGRGESGGIIEVLGDTIGILNGTFMDASGNKGKSNTTKNGAVSDRRDGSAGGMINIGGDYLGGGDTPTAQNLFVDTYTLFYNDATNKGDAGRTIFWSDGDTSFAGNVYARGGAKGGNGGFVETSGHNHLDAMGFVDLTAAKGDRGTYFLDPTNITIYGNFAPDFVSTDGTLNLSTNLKLWLDSSDTSNVNLTYNSLGSTATGTSGNNTITVNTNTGLVVGARIRLGGAGSVTAASTLGANTYTISAINGNTITLSSNLTTSYAGSAVYQGYVSQLTDKSGLGYSATQATAANMPLWISNGQNGLGTTDFDGSTGFLTTSLDGTKNTLPNASFFAVFNPATVPQPNNYSSFWGVDGTASWNRGMGIAGVGSSFYLAGTGSGPVTGGTAVAGTAYIGSAIYQQGVNNGSLAYINGNLVSSTFTENQAVNNSSNITIGQLGVGRPGQRFDGTVPEFVVYGTALSADAQALVNQYQSAKWDVALTPPGTGATEAAKAMASDGYSVFTTRYLERLSQSADISLQATNNINLDFKGDTLSLAADKNFTLTAGNNITSLSGGKIATDRTTTGGNITMTAGGAIDIRNLIMTTGDGAVDLNATGNVSMSDMVNTGTGGVDVDGYDINVYGGGPSISNLVALWNFNNGTANDSSGNNNNGTLNNGPVSSSNIPSAVAGNTSSISLDGVNDNITNGPVLNTAGNTVSFWTYLNNSSSASVGQAIVTTTNGATPYFTVMEKDGYIRIFDYSVQGHDVGFTGDYAYNGTFSSGAWHLVSITHTATAEVMYIDGQPVISRAVGTTGSNTGLRFGWSYYGGGTTTGTQADMSGLLDDVRVYNSALSSLEIAALYNPVTWQTGTTNFNAAHNLNLDLKGETLTLGSNKNLTINAANNIAVASAGKIATSRSAAGGNITMNAGGNIDLTSTYLTSGNGNVTLASTGDMKLDDINSGTGGIDIDGHDITLYGHDLINAGATWQVGDGSITAAHNLVLDLQGDTINVSSLDNFYLTTTNGNISTASTGTFRQPNGGYTGILAGGAGNIYFNHAFTLLNTTNIYLAAAGGSINAATDLTINASALNLTGNLIGSGAGTFTYAPGRSFHTLSVGTGGSSDVTISDALVTQIKAGWDNYVFGRTDGAIVSNYTTAWDDPVKFLTNTAFRNWVATVADDSFTAIAGSSIELRNASATITANGAGDAIVLSADDGTFSNLPGPSGLSAPNGRWLVYSYWTPYDARYGLLPDASEYGKTYPLNAPNTIGAGNRFVYMVGWAPDLTVTPNAVSVTYGDAISLNGYAYTITGYSAYDEAQDIVTGTLVGSTTYTQGSNVGTYNINRSSGTLSSLIASKLGYTFTYANSANAITVAARTLTATLVGAVNKTYNATTTATLTGANYNLANIYNSDDVSLNIATSGTYNNKNAGSGKTVSVNGLSITGAKSSNYVLASSSISGAVGAIATAGLDITGVTGNNKVYDATTNATLNTGSAALSGVFGGDTVTLGSGSATGSFLDKNVGNGKAITVSGFTIGGGDSGNYSLNQPAYVTANITPASLGITGVTANNKVYDSLLTAPLNTGSAALSGVLGSDAVTLDSSSAAGLFANKNVGNGKAVTASGFTLGGGDSGNYTLSQPAGLTANITPYGLTISGVSGTNKVYDATTADSITGAANLNGVFGGDTVTLDSSSAAASFADKNVGNGKTVTFTGYALTAGGDSGNYTLSQPSTSTANITAASLNITGVTANNKVYDALLTTILNTGSAALSGVFGGDTVILDSSSASGSFANKNVGNGKVVTASGFTIGGGDSGNYTLTQPAGLTANITPYGLTITGVSGTNKVYDATTADSITGIASLNGVFGSDTVTLDSSGAAANFANKNVGNGKTVTFTGYAIGGGDSGNYTLSQPSTSTANITPASLGITGVTANNKIYDALLTATLNTSSAALSGVLGSDTVTLNSGGAAASFANKDVGNGKAVTASGFTLGGGDSGNYTFSQPAGLTANITPAALTITADNKTREKGEPDPAFTAHYNGFVGGENSSLVSGLTFNTPALINSPAGLYDIIPSGASAANYDISYVNGVLTIIVPSTVAVPDSVMYTAQIPSPTLIFTTNENITSNETSSPPSQTDENTEDTSILNYNPSTTQPVYALDGLLEIDPELAELLGLAS